MKMMGRSSMRSEEKLQLPSTLRVLPTPQRLPSFLLKMVYKLRSLKSRARHHFRRTTSCRPTTGEGYSLRMLRLMKMRQGLAACGHFAFGYCSELKSMTIPDSLQTPAEDVFPGCSKLVPSLRLKAYINAYESDSEKLRHKKIKKKELYHLINLKGMLSVIKISFPSNKPLPP